MDWLHLPRPPKPSAGHEVTAGARVKGLVSVVEERIVARDSLNSQITPTSVARAHITSITSTLKTDGLGTIQITGKSRIERDKNKTAKIDHLLLAILSSV